MSEVHIKDFKNIHMVGIGGASMSGLALMLIELGYKVKGSDATHNYGVKGLEARGVEVKIGHDPTNIKGADLLVYTASIAEDNPERIAAMHSDIPQMERKILLGQLMEAYDKSICICGTHGKTTTSGMVAKTLLDCKFNPSIHIGGVLDSVGGSTRMGGREYFVVEACEFNASFHAMIPQIAVVLNIKEDHLDFFKDIEDIENTFRKFLDNLSKDGIAIGCGDDERARRVVKEKPINYTFGFEEDNDMVAMNIEFDENACASFDVIYRGEKLVRVKLGVPGKVQILDALACFLVSYLLGAKPKKIAKSLETFEGVHRRFELTGEYDGIRVYNDYGHNPEEMQQVIETARILTSNKLYVVVQPHTYTRVKRMFDGYVKCTKAADVTLLTDIYAAREQDPGDIHSMDIVEAMEKDGMTAVYTPKFSDALRYLKSHLEKGDVVLTLGGGDINELNNLIDESYNSDN